MRLTAFCFASGIYVFVLLLDAGWVSITVEGGFSILWRLEIWNGLAEAISDGPGEGTSERWNIHGQLSLPSCGLYGGLSPNIGVSSMVWYCCSGDSHVVGPQQWYAAAGRVIT